MRVVTVPSYSWLLCATMWLAVPAWADPLVELETRLAQARSTHGVTGKGVAVASQGRYVGGAPESTLSIVKFTSDGAPAHDNQAAEAAFYNAALFPKALDFAVDKARELGLPLVTLANFGSMGSHAGTFEAYLTLGAYSLNDTHRFLSHVSQSKTIWSGATRLYNIAPNSYVFRTSWQGLNGGNDAVTTEGAVGANANVEATGTAARRPRVG